jgi:hypothetical protein
MGDASLRVEKISLFSVALIVDHLLIAFRVISVSFRSIIELIIVSTIIFLERFSPRFPFLLVVLFRLLSDLLKNLKSMDSSLETFLINLL